MRALLICWIIFVGESTWALPSNLSEKSNKTITDLVNDHVETVKKIVASHNSGHIIKKEEQKEQPPEDLKSKCEHYFKMNKININGRIESITTTQKSTATLKPNDSNKNHLKIIKLEPVTLQKTTLNNGEVVYYWYKKVPANLLQNGPSFYQQLTTTTTTTTTTPPPPPSTEPPYIPQMKFIIPMPLPNEDKNIQNSPPIDHYAYYPKEAQPAAINMPAPYVPVFHMIHAITIPNQEK